MSRLRSIPNTIRQLITVGAAVVTIPVLLGAVKSGGAEVGIDTSADNPVAARLYQKHCASCHSTNVARAPARVILSYMNPQLIYAALNTGVMSDQGKGLSDQEKVTLAEYLSGRSMNDPANTPAIPWCKAEHRGFDLDEPPPFSGWGLTHASTHAVATATAGLDRRTAGKLKVKWAYGFAGAQRMRSQPGLAGGAIFVGSHDGTVLALDRHSGCVRWQFMASAEVRTGIVISPWPAGDKSAQPLVYFGDVAANAYALNAFSGELVWKVSVDEHPAAVITGAPTLYEDTLYVPVSSLEEASAAAPDYACCNFRGSVIALDARSGEEKWRRYLVDEARPQGAKGKEVARLGPSGVPVWNSPAIDVKRRQLYIATGDNYSAPATELSDAVVALDLNTGRINWHYQATAGDAWNMACITTSTHNCPEDSGPDFDFGAGTVLAKAENGRELVLAGQKSGFAYGIDPDTGKLVWKTRVGRGGMAGGILFGMAADSGRLYVPVSDALPGGQDDFPASPGLYALDIANGNFIWRAPAPDTCGEKQFCVPGYGGSVTATPELVLAGADDGYLRIYAALDGKLLWEIDTGRPFETVNGVLAHGGAIAGGIAPIVYEGQIIVASGYGFVGKAPGNLLLVLERE